MRRMDTRTLARATLGVVVGALALSTAGGCAASAATRALGDVVDVRLTEVFPEEGRRWSYEAENEVIIALDRLDAARDVKLSAEARVAEAERLLEVIEKRGGQGREVAEARKAQMSAEVSAADEKVGAAEMAVFCARASLELTKARLAVRFDLPVEEGYVEKFEDQYEDCARDLEEASADAEREASEALKAKEEWRKTRAAYVQKTGDHDHGFWID
jgi:tRNA A37 N6-isopentenylltransferase MiaA